MAINQVRAQINGTWHVLTYNSGTQRYEKTITAPNVTSYNVNAGHYYPVTVEASNTAGSITTVNDASPNVGPSLRLTVKEKVKPIIAITSPGAGAFVTNARQPIIFQLRDEANGSGIDLSTMVLKVDNGTAITSASSGMVCTPVTNGYDCTYTPPANLADGAHTITINVSDFDGNTATQASRTYTVDTVPPTLNVTNPSAGLITNNTTLIVQGTTNDATSSPVTVTIKRNGVDQGPVTITSGSFSKSITLVEGANELEIKSIDGAGRSTTVTRTVTLDTSVPVVNNVTITPNPVDAGVTMIISVQVTG